MDIFIIIVSIVIILFLLGIYNKLTSIDRSADEIRDMVKMSDEQKYKYSLKIDDPDGYHSYLEGKHWKEEAKKKKKEEAR